MTTLRELAQAYLARETARANIDSDTDEWWDASDAVDEAASALLAVLPEGELDVICRAILAALDAEREVPRWQPIEDAPAREWIVVHQPSRLPWDSVTTARYVPDVRQWLDACGHIVRPTRWQHLPAPPDPLPARSGSGTEAARGAAVDNAPETEAP